MENNIHIPAGKFNCRRFASDCTREPDFSGAVNVRRYKLWIIFTNIAVLTACIAIAAVTVYFDPFFHYHKPLDNYEYPFINERYQNDGISRNFEYDGIITGTSHTENFKTTEADKLFGADFIKVPYSGGSFKEINDNLKRAFDAGKKIRYIIRGLDCNKILMDKDDMRYDEYPSYLYNDNLLDDVNYVLNKTILIDHTLNVIKYTKEGNKTETFDAYANWSANVKYGAENVFLNYELEERADTIQEITDDEIQTIRENIKQNVTDLAMQHPETQFYLFFPPSSICSWDELENRGGGIPAR